MLRHHHVRIVRLWCHWPSTASSIATVLISCFGSFPHQPYDRVFNWAAFVPSSCSRRVPIVLLSLNRIFRSTKHDIRASMYDKIGFCPLWRHFHFLSFVCFSEILDTERMKFELTRIPKIDYIKSIVLFYMVANDPNFMSFSKIRLRNTIIVCLYDSKTKTLT